MKRTIRNRIAGTVVATLVVLGLGSAVAAPTTLHINDQALDYGDTGEDTAYLSFGLDGAQLVVNLSNSSAGTAIPAIDLLVPAPVKTDIAGDDIEPTLADVDTVTTAAYGNQTLSIGVTHKDTSLAAVSSSYHAALAALGFELVDTSDVSSNIDVAMLSKGDTNIKLVFHRSGSDVTAFVTGI